MANVYNTEITKAFPSNILIVPLYGTGEDGFFGFRLCRETDADANIAPLQAYTAQPLGEHCVFTHTDGKNYVIYEEALYQKHYWFVNDGSFLLLGMENNCPVVHDFNRECEWVSPTFNKVYQWCNSRNFKPLMGIFINDKSLPIEEFSRIIGIVGRFSSRIENPELDFGSTIENWNTVYLQESVSVLDLKILNGNTVQITFENAPDGQMDVVQKCGVIKDKTVYVQNQVGNLLIDPAYMDTTSFDIVFNKRVIETVVVKSILLDAE